MKSNRRRIAIVEDTSGLLALYSKMLRLHCHEIVFTTDNAKEALEALKRKEKNKPSAVDCMIIDYKTMTKNDGLDSIGAAAKISGSSPGINIIFVGTDVSIEKEVKSLGFEYLRKPFTATELLGLL